MHMVAVLAQDTLQSGLSTHSPFHRSVRRNLPWTIMPNIGT